MRLAIRVLNSSTMDVAFNSSTMDVALNSSTMDVVSHILEPQQWRLTSYVVVAAAFLIYVLVSASRKPAFPRNSPPLLKGTPVLGLLKFFSSRPDVFNDGLAASKTGNFSFYFGKKQIVGLQGEAGRKAYFESRGLNIAHG